MPKRKKLNQAKKPSVLPRLALLLIGIGIILLLVPGIFYLNQTIQLKFFTPTISQSRIISKNETPQPLPTALSIPAIKLSLPIGQTTFRNNSWGIYKDGASHLDISARPGEKGPIILYAHNTLDRFGSLPFVPPGQKIMITTQDQKKHSYTVIQRFETDANRVDLFARKEETLILYTCSGFADLKRFVVIAHPTK